MQSQGPQYQGPQINPCIEVEPLTDRFYDNRNLNSNTYLPYHFHQHSQLQQHPHQHQLHQNSSYSQNSHYNSNHQFHSTQLYNSSSNHYNNCSDPYSIGNNNRYLSSGQLNQGGIKTYWSDNLMSVQNAPQFHQSTTHSTANQRISIQNASQMHSQLRSPCHPSGNGYSNANPRQSSSSSSSSSPQAWTQSPGLMQSPRGTPSPLPASSQSRSPFSPTPMAQNKLISTSMPLNNHNISNNLPQADPNPLQSLQKMFMIDRDSSDSSISRNNYETIPLDCSSPSSTPIYSEQKTFFNLTDSLNTSELESPFPIYYNLDQHRLCTPPASNHTISNVTNYTLLSETSNKLSSSGSSIDEHSSIKRREENLNCVANENLSLNKSKCKAEEEKVKDKVNLSTHLIIKGEQPSHCDQLMPLSTSFNLPPKLVSDSTSDSDSKMQTYEAKMNHYSSQSQWKVNQDNREPTWPVTTATSATTLAKPTKSEALGTLEASETLATPATSTTLTSTTLTSTLTSTTSATSPSLATPVTSATLATVASAASTAKSSSLSPSSSPTSNPKIYCQKKVKENTYNSMAKYSDSEIMPPPPSSASFLGHSENQSTYGHQESSFLTSSSASCHQLSQEELLIANKKKRGRPFGSKNRAKSGISEDTLESGEEFKSEENLVEMNESIKSIVKKKSKSEMEDIGVNTILSLDVQSDQQLTIEPLFPIPPLPSSKSSKSKKPSGPFVRVEKGKSNKILYSIVNVSKKLEDEKDLKKGKNWNQLESRSAAIWKRPYSVINASKKKLIEISQPLDGSFNQNSNWICVFCKQPSHYKGLGDLFGPYFITVDKKLNTSLTDVSDCKSSDTESNDRLKGNKIESNKRKKTDNSDFSDKKSFHPTTLATDSNELNELTKENTTQQEIWFHEDCIVWSNGVYLVGNLIRNMEDVVKDCLETVCCKCKLGGASLGCLHKGCLPRFHYLCAKEKGCDMDEENFSIHCFKHKKKSKDS